MGVIYILTYIWSALMLCGIFYTALFQGGDAVVAMLNSGIEKAFGLFVTLAPIMCFWSGIMEVGSQSGVTRIIARLLSPLTHFLFGREYKNTVALQKISMNMSANILGMGNAATPLGLAAMKELDLINSTPWCASDAMCMFIVINTASIQLIPSSVIALRGQLGSQSPSDIIVPTIITTLCAFAVGTLSAKLFARVPCHE